MHHVENARSTQAVTVYPYATELVLDRQGFSETFDLLDFSKWSRKFENKRYEVNGAA